MKDFEHCEPHSEESGRSIKAFSVTLLFPLNVESRGNADGVGGTPPIGSGNCMVEDSVKEKGCMMARPSEKRKVYAQNPPSSTWLTDLSL